MRPADPFRHPTHPLSKRWHRLNSRAPRDRPPRAFPKSAQRVRSRFSSQRTTTISAKFRGQLDALRLAPEAFEVVKLPRLLLKHVHYEIAVIKKDPLGGLVTFDTQCRMARLLQRLVN